MTRRRPQFGGYATTRWSNLITPMQLPRPSDRERTERLRADFDGTLERIHHELYVAVREQEGREPSPTANVQDRDGAFPLIRRARQLFPLIERIFADGGYAGRKMAMTVPFRQGHKRFRQVVLSIG